MLLTDFSRDDYSGPPMTNLVDIIKYVKPTALLGLSTITVSPKMSRAIATRSSLHVHLLRTRRARSLRKSFKPWLRSMLAPLFSLFRTLSGSPSVRSLRPWNTLMDKFSLHPVHPSPSKSSRELPSILARGITCTSSQVCSTRPSRLSLFHRHVYYRAGSCRNLGARYVCN